MEHKIGEIFEYNGEWYQCIRSILTCSSCEIPRPCTKIRELGCCSPNMRNDKEQVVFKKLEKVGEPFAHYCPSGRIIYFQRYKLFYKLYSHNTEYIMCDFNEDGIVSIEIKQNKEDMEEKKQKLDKLVEDYSYNRIPYEVFDNCLKQLYVDKQIGENNPSLKEFDLEAAKQGKPVCTRDGRKARIICFDAHTLYGNREIIALVAKPDGCEYVEYYTQKGKFSDSKEDRDDLMMLPEKKEGWANVYDDTPIYDTKEEALNRRSEIRGYIDTVKVSWEE